MLLPWLVVIPIFSGFFCWKTERISEKVPRFVALIIFVLMLALSLQFLLRNNEVYSFAHPTTSFFQKQTEFNIPWIPRFGINIHLVADSFSLVMVILTEFLGVLSVLCSWNEVKKHHGLFYFNIMFILGSTIGVFFSSDLFLFFFFWEIMLIPTYFLIAIWGHKDFCDEIRISSAIKFLIYTQISGLIMLIAILLLVFIHYNSTGVLVFDYKNLLNTVMSHNMEYFLMLAFFFSFAIKIPIVPFHGWLPDTYFSSSTEGSVDLIGILPKTAAYGLIHFSFPLFPKASMEFAPIAMFLGLFGIFYGAWIALMQNDIKKIISYISLSHMGFLLIGIYSRNALSLHGGIIQMISHSLSTSGLLILCGQLYDRFNTRDISIMGGCWSKIKWLPGFFLFFTAATLGIPGTGNFIGEFMILLGSYEISPLVTSISAFNLVFSSLYSLKMLHYIFFGEEKKKSLLKKLRKISLRELFMNFSLVISLVLIGLRPQLVLNIL